jgi:hypothetical protein
MSCGIREEAKVTSPPFPLRALLCAVVPASHGDGDQSLNSGLCTCKADTYHLSHTSSPFGSGYFGDRSFGNYFPRLALIHHPPDLSLPNG